MTGESSSSRSCSRRMPNIWMPWMPDGGRPVSTSAQSRERFAHASASSSRPSHSASVAP